MKIQVTAAAIVLYVILASIWGDPDSLFKFWRAENMRFFVPIAVVLGYFFTYARHFRLSDADEDDEEFEPMEHGPIAVAKVDPAPAAAAQMTVGQAATAEGMSAWERALATPHSEIPDADKDASYLKLLYAAARGGVVGALVELSEYAFARNALVESFYWLHKADMATEGHYRRQSNDLVHSWSDAGRPLEVDNHYEQFTEEDASFARALMNVRAGFDVLSAKRYLRQLADAGHEDAMRFFD